MMTDDSFNLPPRYKYLKPIGTGTYGTVIAAYDQVINKKVAIKKLRRINDVLDAKRVLREIRILKNMRHENILGLTDLIYNNKPGYVIGDIYLVSDLMETDLQRLIKATHISLEDTHIKYITYQLIRALAYLHTANIIHRDLKPSNILLTESCDIKIWYFNNSQNNK